MDDKYGKLMEKQSHWILGFAIVGVISRFAAVVCVAIKLTHIIFN